MRNNNASKHEIKKLHLEGVVLFAINNIPHTDSTTLKQFLELVNTGGTFGTISHERILRKMNQVLKYVPGACPNSLLILVDLLEIKLPNRLALDGSQNEGRQPGDRVGGLMPLFIEVPEAVALDSSNEFYSSQLR